MPSKRSPALDKGNSKQEHIHVFLKPPSCNVRLAIGRKYRRWYLIIAKDYPWLANQEITRLDKPGYPVRFTPEGQPCFWFDPNADSPGWDREGQPMLDFLLSIPQCFQQAEVLKVVSEDTAGQKEVEIRIPTERIANCCEDCGRWESIENGLRNTRWILCREGKFPGYLCPECFGRDWAGTELARSLRRVFQKR